MDIFIYRILFTIYIIFIVIHFIQYALYAIFRNAQTEKSPFIVVMFKKFNISIAILISLISKPIKLIRFVYIQFIIKIYY